MVVSDVEGSSGRRFDLLWASIVDQFFGGVFDSRPHLVVYAGIQVRVPSRMSLLGQAVMLARFL